MAGVFTSILEASKWLEFEEKELITYSFAGFLTGAIGSIFIKPFQIKTLGRQAFLMAGVAGLYTKVEEFNQARDSRRNAGLADQESSNSNVNKDSKNTDGIKKE
jgi:hypothetical protein